MLTLHNVQASFFGHAEIVKMLLQNYSRESRKGKDQITCDNIQVLNERNGIFFHNLYSLIHHFHFIRESPHCTVQH